MTRMERIKLAVGYTGPDEDLIEAVKEASIKRLEPKQGPIEQSNSCKVTSER